MRDIRLGRFSVDLDILDNPDSYTKLFEGCIILEAKADFLAGQVHYTAWHKDFDKLAEGCVATYYSMTFDEAGRRIWQK